MRLRVTTGNGLIAAGPGNMIASSVTIPVIVPRGVGTLQASARFTAP